MLGDLGYLAIEAEGGAVGLKLLETKRRIDLLVTDVGLPGGINGRQLADAALALRPHLKVLFFTGYAENAVIGDGHLRLGMHVLTKPFAIEVLASRIKYIISTESIVDRRQLIFNSAIACRNQSISCPVSSGGA